MRTEFLWGFSVLRVTSGARVKLAGRKSALNPTAVYSTDRSKAVVPVLVLLFVAFVAYSTRGFVLCLALCYFVLVFLVLLALRLPRLGKRELVLMLFVRLFDLHLFGFVCFLFLLMSGKGCGFRLGHSLDFSLTLFLLFSKLLELTCDVRSRSSRSDILRMNRLKWNLSQLISSNIQYLRQKE